MGSSCGMMGRWSVGRLCRARSGLRRSGKWAGMLRLNATRGSASMRSPASPDDWEAVPKGVERQNVRLLEARGTQGAAKQGLRSIRTSHGESIEHKKNP